MNPISLLRQVAPFWHLFSKQSLYTTTSGSSACSWLSEIALEPVNGEFKIQCPPQWRTQLNILKYSVVESRTAAVCDVSRRREQRQCFSGTLIADRLSRIRLISSLGTREARLQSGRRHVTRRAGLCNVIENEALLYYTEYYETTHLWWLINYYTIVFYPW